MIGTIVGGIAIVMLTACFPQDRIAFLAGLAFWSAACAFVATILRNFLALAGQLAGVTAAIIAGNQLGATGGVNGDAFMLAVTRCTEICIGIVCAGIILAGTDFGNADRRLATRIASIATEIIGRFAAALAVAGPKLSQTQPVRQEFTRRVVELDLIIERRSENLPSYVRIRRCYRQRWTVCSRRWPPGASLRFTLPAYRLTRLNN